MKGIENLSLSRRGFMGAGLAAGTLVLGFHWPLAGRAASRDTGAVPLNAFIAIDPHGGVTIQNPFIEMGQGTYTAIPMILGEELDVDLSRVRVEQAPHGDTYKVMFNDTLRFTGGSSSVRSTYDRFRRVGATARAMLLEAASAELDAPVSELSTAEGRVHHAASGRSLDYGALVSRAAVLPVPAQVPLKDPARFRLLGKPVARTDVAVKCDGSAQFGADVRLPGMWIACLRQTPQFGGRSRVLNRDEVLAMSGVHAVDELDDAVAVLGTTYWHAQQGLERLRVESTGAPSPDFSSAAYEALLRRRLDDPGLAAEDVGNAVAALRNAATTLDATYVAPLLAHATMEPQNCTALVEGDRCTLWAPNQGVDFVAQVASRITGLPLEAITVHTPFLGGGFGRRFINDFVVQAVSLARAHPGIPIKVMWSREEDMQHDFYRPMTASRCQAAFDEQGRPLALYIRNAGDGPGRRHFPNPEHGELDGSVVEGAWHQPYDIASRRVDYIYEHSPAPIGYWRSVGSSMNAFFVESFMDEMAHAVKREPVDFRRSLLGGAPRHRKVLDTAVDMAGWRRAPWQAEDGRRHAMGIALHESFGSIVAEVAEVSLAEDGAVTVHRVWAAVDCGFCINPLITTMQLESAIAYGLSAALGEEVFVEGGRTTNSNFHDYRILTAQQMPSIEVAIVDSGEALGGIGEVGTPPIAPAVCNALFTLTGKRVRRLPVNLDATG